MNEFDFSGILDKLSVQADTVTPWSNSTHKQIIQDILYWKNQYGYTKSDFVLSPSPPKYSKNVHTKTNWMQECWCGESHIFKGLDADGNPYNLEDFQ